MTTGWGRPLRRPSGVPLAWFPRLLSASPEQRRAVEISAFGLHWEALDEDISVAGLLAGRGDRTVIRNDLPQSTRQS
jgi:hypothetical protein